MNRNVVLISAAIVIGSLLFSFYYLKYSGDNKLSDHNVDADMVIGSDDHMEFIPNNQANNNNSSNDIGLLNKDAASTTEISSDKDSSTDENQAKTDNDKSSAVEVTPNKQLSTAGYKKINIAELGVSFLTKNDIKYSSPTLEAPFNIEIKGLSSSNNQRFFISSKPFADAEIQLSYSGPTYSYNLATNNWTSRNNALSTPELMSELKSKTTSTLITSDNKSAYAFDYKTYGSYQNGYYVIDEKSNSISMIYSLVTLDFKNIENMTEDQLEIELVSLIGSSAGAVKDIVSSMTYSGLDINYLNSLQPTKLLKDDSIDTNLWHSYQMYYDGLTYSIKVPPGVGTIWWDDIFNYRGYIRINNAYEMTRKMILANSTLVDEGSYDGVPYLQYEGYTEDSPDGIITRDAHLFVASIKNLEVSDPSGYFKEKLNPKIKIDVEGITTEDLPAIIDSLEVKYDPGGANSIGVSGQFIKTN